jgi:WD40 repeat protein
MLIDLYAQIYSEAKKEDLNAKIQEHTSLRNSRLATDKVKHLSQNETVKIQEQLEHDRLAILDIKFEYLCNGFHSAAIDELHTCLQRPILLTCSQEDGTVRIWNYITNNCELVMNFNKKTGDPRPLRCCALHPSGYYMAIALIDQLTVYHILHNDLRVFHSYDQKNIKQLKFSSGG